MPSNETIISGAYPFLNDFYVVIRADELPESPARKLRDWLVSPQGKAIMENIGYTAVGE